MKSVALLTVVVGVVSSAYVAVPLGALTGLRNAGMQMINDRMATDNQRVLDAIEAFKPINASCNAKMRVAIPKCQQCVQAKCKARSESVCQPKEWQRIFGKALGFFTDEIPNFVKNTLPDVLVNKVGGGIVDATRDIGNFIKTKIGGDFGNTVGNGIADFGQTVSNGIGKAVDGIKSVGNKAIDGIKNAGNKAIDGIKNAGNKAIDGIKSVGSKALGGIKTAGNKAIEGIKKVGNKIKEFGGKVGNFFRNLFGKRDDLSQESYVRLRRQTEPVCSDFEIDAKKACKFYLQTAYCTDCGFNPESNGILAHAFYPKDGRVHFDDDENWVLQGNIGKNLELIATHEFGHALGLQHSEIWGTVMSPYFQGFTPDFQLQEDDIKAITYLYGAKPTVDSGVVSLTNTPNICKMKFDDIVRLPERRYYVFRKEWLYKLNSQSTGVESGWPKLANKVYEDFPNTPDAVVYSHRNYRLYAFKGTQVWRYYKHSLDMGFPAKILENVTSIRSAFSWKDGMIYGLSARDVHRFDEDNLSWTWISSLRDVFPDAPLAPEAAVWNNRNSLYFFKGYRFYNIDDKTRVTKQGYPQSKHDLWLGCHLQQRHNGHLNI